MITHIDIVRHGNALKIPGIDDKYRPLSEQGVQQACLLRSKYNGEASKIVAVIHSPAPRALCTAAIAVGEARPLFIPVIPMWPDEYSVDGQILDRAFNQYGYNSAQYRNDIEAAGALHRYGARIAKDPALVAVSQSLTEGQILMIAGHAVLLNYIAYHVSGEMDNRLLFLTLNEAERVRLSFCDMEYCGMQQI